MLLKSFSLSCPCQKFSTVFRFKTYDIISLERLEIMRIQDRNALNGILAHKEYFDQKLIQIATTAEDKIQLLELKNNQLTKEIKELKTYLRAKDAQIKDKDYKINEMSRLIASKEMTIEEVMEELNNLKKEIQKEREENDRLLHIVEENIRKNEEIQEDLSKQIKKLKFSNSTNSNLGTSHDILSHAVAKAQANTRVKSNRKRGGQKGHPVHKSQLSETPSTVIIKRVKKVPAGAKKVMEENEVYYATQEVDIQIGSKIIETRYYLDGNGDELDKDTLNKFAINPVCYTDRFKASVVYLNHKGAIALERLTVMLSELSGGTITVRPSAIVKWTKEISDKSDSLRLEIISNILSSPVVHVDETGEKIKGNNAWIHTITNSEGAFFISTEKRGDIEKGPVAYLENYDGILVHDHFKTYQRLSNCEHSECNAHIDRYLKSGIDIDQNEDCQKMLDFMHELLRIKEDYLKRDINEMPKEEIAKHKEKYLKIAKTGLKNYYEKQKGKNPTYVPDYVPTFRRMIEYVDDHLRFITDFKVPYTNNAAERQCRVIKSKKKISGQFVSKRCAKAYADILTIIQTANIRNENALDALIKVFI